MKGSAGLIVLGKACDTADGRGLWKILQIYGVDRKLVRVVEVICMMMQRNAAVRVGFDKSDFNVLVGEG